MGTEVAVAGEGNAVGDGAPLPRDRTPHDENKNKAASKRTSKRICAGGEILERSLSKRDIGGKAHYSRQLSEATKG
jgi:hypothetical protein